MAKKFLSGIIIVLIFCLVFFVAGTIVFSAATEGHAIWRLAEFFTKFPEVVFQY